MPRTSNRGGARTGTPGQAFGNRTDLNQPKMVATGQAYGAAGQQAASESAVPLPNNQGQMAALAQGAASAGQNPPTAGAADQVYPGELGAFHRPTDQPGSPVTAGSPMGPGPGPEAMTMVPQQSNLAQTIANIAQQSGNPSIMALAQKAQAQTQQQTTSQPQQPTPAPMPTQPQQVMPNGA